MMPELYIQISMSVLEEHQDVITTVLILMEAIIVLAWMDMYWNQIITLVQVMIMCMCMYIIHMINLAVNCLICGSVNFFCI